MITAIYRFERFDPATNTELWRRIPRWKLRLMWLQAWLKRDRRLESATGRGCTRVFQVAANG